MADDANLFFPVWNLSAFSGEASSINTPRWTVTAGGGDLSQVFPMSGDMAFPSWALSGVSASDNPFALIVTMPAWTVTAYGGDYSDIRLPSWSVAATMFQDAPGTAEVYAPAWTVAAAGISDGLGIGSVIFPAWTIDADGFQQISAGASMSMPRWRVESAAELSNLAVASIAFAPWSVTAASWANKNYEGTAVLRQPRWSLNAFGYAPASENYRMWVLNTKNNAVTEYNEHPFTGVAAFNGKLYAVGSTGLYRIGETGLDDDQPIVSQVDLGQHDFESSFHKRVPRVYVSGRFDGSMEVHTITAEGGRRKYLVPGNQNSGFMQRRAGMGRGPRSRYWGLGFANRDGADFTLGALTAYPTLDKRRIS